MAYTFNDQIYAIVEPTLGIKLREETPQTEPKRTTYPSGAPQTECFYQNNLLHGPSRFFSENGYLLSETWFWKGHKQGIARIYYASGALYALLRFRNGKKTALQEYFYENGHPRTRETLLDGVLHGDTQLFWPNSQVKRSCSFVQGKRRGLDQIWSASEQLLSEKNHDA
jgi:antitoxin component YwqK of YwqJK toxin-antitoxin module